MHAVYRPNRLKQRLAAGEKVLGCWLEMADPVATEMLSLVGYDFLLIDNEHGPGSLYQALLQLQAMSASPTTSVMRVPWNDPVYLKRALDIGVEGVMIPAIDTAEQALAAVRACRYPPRGARGSAYQVVRGASYGIGAADYPTSAAENLLIVGQIESKAAVDNIEGIAAVDGIDVLFIGPNDLAGSIGCFGDLAHPELASLIGRAERAVKAAGKKLGGIPFGGLGAGDLYARGYDMVLAATDVGLLRDAALADLRKHRPGGA
jgi:2-keto-3-deoxy-L-rhamnonate aldolase RhmA